MRLEKQADRLDENRQHHHSSPIRRKLFGAEFSSGWKTARCESRGVQTSPRIGQGLGDCGYLFWVSPLFFTDLLKLPTGCTIISWLTPGARFNNAQLSYYNCRNLDVTTAVVTSSSCHFGDSGLGFNFQSDRSALPFFLSRRRCRSE